MESTQLDGSSVIQIGKTACSLAALFSAINDRMDRIQLIRR